MSLRLVDSGTYTVTAPETLTGRELADRGVNELIMIPEKVKEFARKNWINTRGFTSLALVGEEVWGLDTLMLHDFSVCTRLK